MTKTCGGFQLFCVARHFPSLASGLSSTFGCACSRNSFCSVSVAVFFLVCFLSAVAPKALFLKDSGSVRYVGYSENSVISLLLGNEIRALPLLEKSCCRIAENCFAIKFCRWCKTKAKGFSFNFQQLDAERPLAEKLNSRYNC